MNTTISVNDLTITILALTTIWGWVKYYRLRRSLKATQVKEDEQ